VIRPIAVYGCESWVVRESMILRMSVVRRKILRKIFGKTKVDSGIWRNETSKELDELKMHRNIIGRFHPLYRPRRPLGRIEV
jgi:hypothetical protein